MTRCRRVAALALVLAAASGDRRAEAARPDAGTLLRLLDARAPALAAPGRRAMTALVAMPPGSTAASLGVRVIAPGVGALRGDPADLVAFAAAHPRARMELSPPLVPLLDRAASAVGAPRVRASLGLDGSGVVVGVVDTGIDLSHAAFLDENGHTRVAWMLDLTSPPIGKHPDLEQRFGLPGDGGPLGAVWSSDDIDDARVRSRPLPADTNGHGTHVAGIAAGFEPGSPYVGIAPRARLVVVALDLDRGRTDVQTVTDAISFAFDRGAAMGAPVVVNLSFGSQLGSHGKGSLFGRAVAALVGSDHPGRAIVAAAGNGGVGDFSHTATYVPRGQRVRVPIRSGEGSPDGGVLAYVSARAGAALRVGLEGPDGAEWVAPVDAGQSRGARVGGANAAVVRGDYDGATGNSPVADGSEDALVAWSGAWPGGDYALTLEGEGGAHVYLFAYGDVRGGLELESTTRDGSVALPAAYPGVLAVGCTVDRASLTNETGARVPVFGQLFDPQGGAVVVGTRPAIVGELCSYSGAGPTEEGDVKPDIVAPGEEVVSARSHDASAAFGAPCSTHPMCGLVDETHGALSGTSMSSPVVAGAVALLFQTRPTLTQDQIVTLVQAGAHRLRAPAQFEGQAGAGELDVAGSLDALDQLEHPVVRLPDRAASWMTASAEFADADGHVPVTAIVQLRTADGSHRADGFDPSRLVPYAKLAGGATLPPTLERKGPGLWTLRATIPGGFGGSALTFGVRFDGQDVVDPKTLPVATDSWTARYAPAVAGGGGCSAAPVRARGEPAALALLALCSVAARLRRRG